jgi:hypothetical protein
MSASLRYLILRSASHDLVDCFFADDVDQSFYERGSDAWEYEAAFYQGSIEAVCVIRRIYYGHIEEIECRRSGLKWKVNCSLTSYPGTMRL